MRISRDEHATILRLREEGWNYCAIARRLGRARSSIRSVALRREKPTIQIPERVFWYFVGLVASDGCLSRDGRHVVITSADKQHLEELAVAMNLPCRVAGNKNVFRLQWGRTSLYQLLIAVGLTPAKSLTIGPLAVPNDGFADFLRGMIDGDGNIRRWRHPSNGREQWTVRIYSASLPFVQWLREMVDRLWRVSGRIHKETLGRVNPLYTLKFGKLASRVVLEQCHYGDGFALRRKRELALRCIATPVGWSRSKTIQDQARWNTWTCRRGGFSISTR